jgi:predicted alpha/beta hydrolase
MQDWGRLDMSAAVEWLENELVDVPIFIVGHSMGGQLLALVDGLERVRGVAMICSSTGAWRDMSGAAFRARCAFFWYVVVPLTTRLLGYVPSRAIGAGEDLPAGVAREWAEWCRRSAYFEGALDMNAFARVRAPILALSFSDDPIANDRTVPALLRLYPNATVKRVHLRPEEVSRGAVGHFGFFSAEGRARLWDRPLDFFDRLDRDPLPPSRTPPR